MAKRLEPKIQVNRPTMICMVSWCLTSSFIEIYLPRMFGIVTDVWKQRVPQPVTVKPDSIYEYYDVAEEIGT